MPLRLDPLKKRWPTFELFILPFLAPRVFTPWPSRSRYGTQTKSKKVVDVVDEDCSHSASFASKGDCARELSSAKHTSQATLPRNIKQCLEENRGILRSREREGKVKHVNATGRRTRRTFGHRDWTRSPGPTSGRESNAYFEIRRDSNRQVGTCSVKLNGNNEEMRSSPYRFMPTVHTNFKRVGKSEVLARAIRRKIANHPASQASGIQDRLFWKTNKLVHHNPKHKHFAVFYGSWHTRFAAVNYSGEPLESWAEGEPAGQPIAGQNMDEVRDMRAEIYKIVNDDSLSSIRQFWTRLPSERASKMWMELMMTALERSPAKALGILSATFMEPYPPAYAVGDVLDFIIAHYCKNQEAYPMRHLADLAENINHILLQSHKHENLGLPSEHVHLASNSLWLLMSVFRGARLKRLYETLLQTNHPLHENTLIQLSYRFAKASQTDTAFEVLKRLKGASFNTPPMLSLCTVILCHKYRDPGAFYTETAIFEFMISCGLTPNTITHNVLIWNSVSAGDHETAWKIHDMMLEAQIMPDKFTYSILLNDAKRRMDAEDIGRVMSFIRREKIVDGLLVTDVLHAIYLLQQEKVRQARRTIANEEPLTAFHSMLPVYCENFQIGNLARIIPGLAEIAQPGMVPQLPNDSEKEIMVPHNGVLTVMIKAYLDAIQNASAAVQFYHHFRSLIYNGDPAVQCLNKDPRVWDMILITFGKFPELVNECAHVMEDMLKPVVKSAGDVADSSNGDPKNELWTASHSTPQPDLYTWSILLKVFMDQKQAAAAERVLSIMKERNIDPSIVTWNTLTYGYVTLQDADMVADAVNRLEEANLAVDEATLDTLKKLRNRNKFLVKLAEKQKRRKVKEDLDEIVLSDGESIGGTKLESEPLDEDEWLEEEFAREGSR